MARHMALGRPWYYNLPGWLGYLAGLAVVPGPSKGLLECSVSWL
jgi:hypothetical protein